MFFVFFLVSSGMNCSRKSSSKQGFPGVGGLRAHRPLSEGEAPPPEPATGPGAFLNRGLSAAREAGGGY